MSKPTYEQYEQARKDNAALSEWICKSRAKQTDLIDALTEERGREKRYMIAFEYNKEIIARYDAFEQAEKGKKK